MSVVAFRSEISEPAPKLDSQVDVCKFPLRTGRCEGPLKSNGCTAHQHVLQGDKKLGSRKTGDGVADVTDELI